MAKDRIDRKEPADKRVELAVSADGQLRTMAEMITDLVLEAEVTATVCAAPNERSDERHCC